MIEVIQKTLEYIQANHERFTEVLTKHIRLDIVCLFFCILIAVPLGYLCAKQRKVAVPVLNLTNIIRIIPTIAFFIILLPFTGIGVLPAAIALTGMSLPTVLINTMAGIQGVEPKVIESARGMGMSGVRTCFEVELPLAMPLILNGIRTATIEIVAGTTIASYIGATGLGAFILAGLNQNKPHIMLAGAVPAAAISIILDLLLSNVQKRVQRKIAA